MYWLGTLVYEPACENEQCVNNLVGKLGSQKASSMTSNQELLTKCQRCQRAVEKDKTPTVSTKSKTMYFCDNCFRAVFKYDETLKTVQMLWEEAGRKTPFTIRSNNWHKSSFMIVKERQISQSSNGKTVFIGDMYLRGVLKEQNKPVGKANHFLWVGWSEELARQHQEPPVQNAV